MKVSKEEEQKFTKVEQFTNRTTGITLVALVVTVVILLILAGVTLTYIVGDNSIFELAKRAKEETQGAIDKEQGDIQNLVNMLKEETKVPEPPKPIEKTTSYVGYYADMDGNGSVDGIIYVDLAKGKTAEGNWGDSDGAYEITAVTTGLKEYAISTKTYAGQTTPGIYKANDGLGEKQVITPVKGSSGTERFYIMALEDVQLAHPYSDTSNTAYWYYNANGKMSDYDKYTSTSFGKGEENTKKMIARWKKDNSVVTDANAVDYGEQNEKDLWGQIDTEVAKGWYVPSKEEWSAFGKELGIKGSDGVGDKTYTDCGLSGWYWSSSQGTASRAWRANFGNGCMNDLTVNLRTCVRLGATF